MSEILSEVSHKPKAPSGFYPRPSFIEAYGNGGFRFAQLTHRGGLFCLPNGVYAWEGTSPEAIKKQDFALLFKALSQNLFTLDLLFVGMGSEGSFEAAFLSPEEDFKTACSSYALRYDFLSTGAAVRSYNLLLSEGRAVAAALLPVA